MFDILAPKKQCKKCGEIKPLEQFVKNKTCKDGREGTCKSCVYARRNNNPVHKERHRRYSRNWDLAHPEQRKQIEKNRDAKHYKKYREVKYAWRRNNKERDLESRRSWYSSNVEKVLEKKRDNYNKNIDRYRKVGVINAQKRRARLRGNGGTITVQEWEDLKKHYDYACLRCGKQEPEIKLTIDHVKPIVLGGANTIDNVQPLCRSCNSSKCAKEIDYR